MTRPVRIEAEAERELLAAGEWYEGQVSGLGHEFLAAAHDVIDQIAAIPSSGALFPHVPEDLQVRRLLMPRFPYAVAYLVFEAEIRILAFAHTHREPGYWLRRHPEAK